jgi:hypothetical protein
VFDQVRNFGKKVDNVWHTRMFHPGRVIPMIEADHTNQGSILQNSISAEKFSDKFFILKFYRNFHP